MDGNNEYSRIALVRLITDIFDRLTPEQRNSYTIGMEVAKVKGKRFKQLAQESGIIISSYVSDILIELLYPWCLDDLVECMSPIRKKCFSEFVQGVVRAC